MGEPGYRMAADAAIALGDVRPGGVLSQPEKDTLGTLVCASGQHNFVTFTERRNGRYGAQHVRVPPLFDRFIKEPERQAKPPA
jgi:hypothetical protein